MAQFTAEIHSHALGIVHSVNASHIGTSPAAAGLLGVLYMRALREDPVRPDWPGRDRLIASKDYGAAGLYAALAERGFLSVAWLADYCGKDGSKPVGHASYHVPDPRGL